MFVYICNIRVLFSSVLRQALSTGQWQSKVLLILHSSGAILLRKFLVDFSPPCIQQTGTTYKIELQGYVRKYGHLLYNFFTEEFKWIVIISG
jgi:hypothetical protein